MAAFTNVSQRLIHAPDGVMMIPGMSCEVSDEAAANQGFQDLVTAGDIVAGPPPSGDELSKMQQEKAEKEAAALQEARAKVLPEVAQVIVTKATVTTQPPHPSPATPVAQTKA